jgi:DNA-binding response OmpR family regulator
VVKVLLVEDDAAVAAAVVETLASAGLEVAHVTTGSEAVAAAGTGVDVVLMDLGLPDMDGLDATRIIRETLSVPIIIVSARGDELDRVLGLELGADDYVVKPFSQRELLARIRAVVRRADSGGTDARSRSASRLVIDEKARRVVLDGEEVAFTAKEFDLLAFLASEPGTVMRRGDILEHVWDVEWYGTTKTLDAHVAAIRKKLGSPDWIQAVRGVGFRFLEVDDRTDR